MPENTVIDSEEHYWRRMGAFEGERVEVGGIVLLGSSHLERFDTGRFLPDRRFVNRGIASDRLCVDNRGILNRLDVSVFQLQPSFIVFNNGVNDLGESAREGAPTMVEIKALYERVIREIRAGEPDVPLLIVNEFPVTGRFSYINPLIPEFNAHIADVALRRGCRLLDIYAVTVNAEGELREELTYDGLHLNDEGYELFARFLAPLLRG